MPEDRSIPRAIKYSVLRPLLVITGSGRIIGVHGPRQRTILTMLILAWGRVVSVDSLVDAVWGDEPPATARTQVAICIGALRKSFKQAGVEGDVILTTHPGYRLETTGSDLDALQFTSLVAEAAAHVKQGRHEQGRVLYRQALDLWKGPALAGVTGRPVEDEATRLDERRYAAYEAWSEVELALGHHQDIISELTSIANSSPLHEQLRYNLMLAQYRAGLRAEATEGFRMWRRNFVDELGLEPSVAIKELHASILQDDPGLTLPVQVKPMVVPAQLPPDVDLFQGRAAELGELDRLLGEKAPGVGLITGVAGVGKTGLIVHWAHKVAGEFPDGQLYADLSQYDDKQPEFVAGALLGRFLRALGVPGDQIPSDPAELASLYRSVLADRKSLIVLDNVRTMSQITALLPGTGRSCVLAASREQLAADSGTVRVDLGLMTAHESQTLITKIAGEGRATSEKAAVSELCRLCDGLPLALRIAAARLVAKQHWSVQHLVDRLRDEHRRLDELSTGGLEVRASFALSYRGLTEQTARMYRLLGLLDVPDFPAWVGGALLDVSPAEAEDMIERLVDAHLLTPIGSDATGTMRYRFHDLLRLYARERAESDEAEDKRRAALHRVFRTYLTLAEQGHIREYGGDFAIIHGSTPRRHLDAPLVGRLLGSPLDWFEAERPSLVASILQACTLRMEELAWDLAMSSVVLFETRNYYDDWRAVSEKALEANRNAGNIRGEAAMCYELASVEMFQQRFDSATPLFTRAFQLFDSVREVHGRALTLRNMAITDRVQGGLRSAMSRLDEARNTFRVVGDASAEAHTLNQMSQIELEWGNPDAAVRLSLEAVRIATALGETRGAAQALNRLAAAYVKQGRFDAAKQSYDGVLRIVRSKGDTRGEAYALMGIGETLVASGQYDEAESILADALEIAERVDDLFLLAKVHLALGTCSQQLNQLTRASQHLLIARNTFHEIGSVWGELQASADISRLSAEACGGRSLPGR
ncbi:AfsR/SARP family transcriptional regulator [Streptomyces sp. NEAU-L66]|uniref:AfsR/SARP family transcriptional regulator n=1 Tax=Streptomyces sp. NEAU-L66 TaxID=3390812 RepID=UPI0039C634FA